MKQKDQQDRPGHLETKIMEAAQATRYPPEAEKRSKRFNDVQVQIWKDVQFFTNESSPAQSSAKANMGTPVALLLKRTTILNEVCTFVFKRD